jgi:hypothetical protein
MTSRTEFLRNILLASTATRPQSMVILTVPAKPCSAAASAFLLGCWHRELLDCSSQSRKGRQEAAPRRVFADAALRALEAGPAVGEGCWSQLHSLPRPLVQRRTPARGI